MICRRIPHDTFRIRCIQKLINAYESGFLADSTLQLIEGEVRHYWIASRTLVELLAVFGAVLEYL
jgi:hypothetical protein